MLMPLSSLAQSDDFGVWTSIGAEKKISKKLSVGMEGELRTRDDVCALDRWGVGVDAQYRLTRWVKVSAG